MVRALGKRKRSTSNVWAKKRKFTRRRFTRNRRRFRGRGNRPVRLYQPVPTRALVKFNYVHTFVQGLAATTPLQYWYRTSLFDPDFTAGGHQPLWHDQFATLYRKYRVYGMKYQISMSNATSLNPVWVYILHAPDSYVGTTNVDTEMERRLCKHKGIMRHATGGNSMFRAKGYIDVPKTEGLGRREFGGHEDYEAAFGANPTKSSKLIIGYNSIANETVHGLIKITLYAECYDPITIGGS